MWRHLRRVQEMIVVERGEAYPAVLDSAEEALEVAVGHVHTQPLRGQRLEQVLNEVS